MDCLLSFRAPRKDKADCKANEKRDEFKSDCYCPTFDAFTYIKKVLHASDDVWEKQENKAFKSDWLIFHYYIWEAKLTSRSSTEDL